MTQATTIRLGGSERVDQPARIPSAGRRLRWGHLWLVPGLTVAIVANQLGNASGVDIVALVAFGIAPDLPRLFRGRGRPLHDLLHHPALPIAAVAVAATGVLGVVWLVAALVWLSHVVMGLAIGDVPRRAARRKAA